MNGTGATEEISLGGHLVIRTLERLGAEVVFGLPGQHALAIFDGLNQSSLRFVPGRTELCAAFAADGYARASGKPAALLVSTGPGALNSLTGLMEAACSHVPVVAISTQIDLEYLGRGRGAIHELADQMASFRRIVKWTGQALTLGSIPGLLSEAWAAACAPPSGPVFLEIPADLIASELADGGAGLDALGELQPRRPRSTPAAIEQVAGILAGAARPVIWAGGGVQRSGAWAEVRALGELLQAPVATTYMGKGSIDEDHPLAVGSSCAEASVQEPLTQADVVLCIGTELGAETTSDHRLELPGQVIQIDAAPQRIGSTYPATPLIGDARLILGELLAAPALQGLDRQTWHERVEDMCTGLEIELLTAIRTTLDRDALCCWDSTMLGYWAAGHFRTHVPRSFLYPVGSGTLGYAWPAAIGAKVALPDRQVLAVVGDGGILYSLSELTTAQQQGIGAKLLIVDDQGYGILRHFQDRRYGRQAAVDLPGNDFVAIAAGFGVPAHAAKPGDLAAALEWAMGVKGPAVVTVEAELRPPPGL